MMVALAQAGLIGELEGAGLVATQSPPANIVVPRGAVVHVVLERPSAVEPPMAIDPELDLEAAAHASTAVVLAPQTVAIAPSARAGHEVAR
jgi:hypothetical protein